MLAVLKFLPKSPLWDRMVLSAAIEGTAAGADPATGAALIPAPGAEGTVVLPLRPTGEIEVDGQRYEARIEVGELPRGARVRIVRRADFVLIVEAVEPGSRPG